jgi:tetratricopeptide (TPR) repeat protein
MAETRPAEDMAALRVAAQEAVGAGRWVEARDGFAAIVDIEQSGEALFGLALALWWLGDPASAIRLQERAFAMFRRERDFENAFVTAMFLCLGYDMTFGNSSASRGWLAKAARVVEDNGLDALQGWVLLCEAVTLHNADPVAAEQKARAALDAARETNDVDLDVCARSELGAALVELGRVSEGTALLDEAMAGALGGEVRTLDAVVLASCLTITSCSRAEDVKRATQWIRAATRFNESTDHHTSTRRAAFPTPEFSSCLDSGSSPRLSLARRCRWASSSSPSCTPRRWRFSDTCEWSRVGSARPSSSSQAMSSMRRSFQFSQPSASFRGSWRLPSGWCGGGWTSSRRTHSPQRSCGDCS